MADQSSIEWTDATWNPVTGCSKVSPGCEHCYAVRETNRHRNLPKYAGLVRDMEWTGEVRCHPELLGQPMNWKDPRRIFVCSMSDMFHHLVPWDFQCAMMDVMAACPHHTFQLLTKRSGIMADLAQYVWPCWNLRSQGHSITPEHLQDARRNPSHYPAGSGPAQYWPANVWAGTSVESQKYAPRLECLARVPAEVLFVSVEPMLGLVNLRRWLAMCGCGDSLSNHLDGGACCLWQPGLCPCTHFQPMLSWVICGGESGFRPRPMHPDWARSLRDDCQAVGVPFFFKQWGAWAPYQDNGPLPNNYVYVGLDGAVREGDALLDTDACMGKVGKKAAGALLDGREWREMPECTV